MEMAGSLGTAVHRELSLQKCLLPNHSKWTLVKAAGHWVLQEVDTRVGAGGSHQCWKSAPESESTHFPTQVSLQRPLLT